MILAEQIKYAYEFLDENIKLSKTLLDVRTDLKLYAELENKVRIPQFLSETSVKLKSDFISNFRLEYPILADSFESGRVPVHSLLRYQNMLYDLSTLFSQLKEANFVIKTDKHRNELRNQVTSILEDLVAVVYSVYDLGQVDKGNTTLSVQQYCEKNSITPNELHDYLYKDIFEKYGCKWLPFEPQHEYYNALMIADPELVEIISDTGFNITNEQIIDVIEGRSNLASLMPDINKYMEERVDVDMTPTDLISSLRLS